ncbi:hypothetical protein FEI17_10335 [Kosakonia radicincitans]|uniref:M14 family metallopeptidase n=1 Tax=Kosakonia radicincitans TaxID=283686 RepID=UPI0011EECCDA|nr:M14 family metallocarboxypeptidase [Kosakonia radicincitans]QEM91007.1 hypothetical protein FEI17_10335 [Kosakonia radicincitans]
MTDKNGSDRERREKGQHVWPVHADNTQSNDLACFSSAFTGQVERWGLYEIVLGDFDKGNISLYQSANQDADVPHILIAAGFHGEEPAGCWGMLDFLRRGSPDLFDNIAVSFLPAVNLSGLSRGQRLNQWGENPNRGFTAGASERPSREGECLIRHAELLKNASTHGVLCCHEDILRDRAYVYSFERGHRPGPFSDALHDALSHFFPLVESEQIDGVECKEGIIFNHFDSSFESWLFSLGADVAACTETPGLQPFQERTEANCSVIGAFVSSLLERNRSGAGMS